LCTLKSMSDKCIRESNPSIDFGDLPFSMCLARS
jgi:hypothetical protein